MQQLDADMHSLCRMMNVKACQVGCMLKLASSHEFGHEWPLGVFFMDCIGGFMLRVPKAVQMNTMPPSLDSLRLLVPSTVL